jgi:glucose-6-phosphate dehydrogenase assembly protein OpcA
LEADLNATRAKGAPRWCGDGVAVGEVAAQLARLHVEHQRRDRGHASARTLNLIIAPCRGHFEDRVVREVDRLGAHSPARTLVLREHSEDRLDAEVVLDCEARSEGGRVGVCHDRVVLEADARRLGHADSLVAGLVLPDLPTVLWLPDPGEEVCDPALLERASHVVLDTGADPYALDRVAPLLERARVSDLAWIRLERWRAAIASTFEPPQERAVLARLEAVEIAHAADAVAQARLLGAWIAARAGVDMAGVALHERREGEGIAGVVLRSADQRITVAAPPRTLDERWQFAAALVPASTHRRGYGETIAAMKRVPA